jgi:Protein phosphatase 2C
LHQKVCPITPKTATLALGLACQNVQDALATKAIALGIEPSDLATTLIVVLASRSFVAVAHIGDGAVVVGDQDGKLTTVTPPTNGEFANETVLLGYKHTVDFKINCLTKFRVKSVAVFSDGLQRLALQMPQGIPHAPFFDPIFDRLQRQTEIEMEHFLKSFLNSTPVNNRTDDDKSLVIAQIL